MNHIELFAGCGGLTLGLEKQGFDLLMANELSPMAAETFAYNILGADLSSGDIQKIDKVFWISSEFDRNDLVQRLRENPADAAGLASKVSDLDGIRNYNKNLRRSLLVGSIIDLNDLIARGGELANSLLSGFGNGGVDLVSGGPPCQSFSMAGMRQRSNSRNQLPWQFADFVEKVQPRMALLENVTGILRAFNIGGKSYYAWFEVCKAFSLKGYVPICLHVNAKYVGAAQNRPRFIMLAFRRDIFNKIRESALDPFVESALDESDRFFDKIQAGREPALGDISYHDVEDMHGDLFRSEFFTPLVARYGKSLVSVKEAIDDLRGSRVARSEYVNEINLRAFGKKRIDKVSNLEHRTNSDRVKARFRVFQVISKLEQGGYKEAAKQVSRFLRTEDPNELSTDTLRKLLKYKYLMKSGQFAKFSSSKQIVRHLGELHTKKQTQKALVAYKPAPAALSIPDDACHYHDSEQRTLSVREMARIQSFPDWFEFRSKVTTGGQMRKYEVPQYTQVGNAVPPLLGLALGEVCKALLDLSADGKS